MKARTVIVRILVALLVVAALVGCESDAYVASYNVSKAADQFEIFRRVVFYNGITGEYILVVEGYCSIQTDTDGDLNLIVKTEDGSYLKHFLGLSDNVTYFAEQIEPARVSDARYRVIFKPSVIIPDIDVR